MKKWLIANASIVFLLHLFTITCFGQQLFSLSGTITISDNSTLPGTNIFLPELNMGTASDKDGKYHINNLKPGKYKVQYSFIGYESVIMDVFIFDQDVMIDIMMHPSSFHSETVVISGGRPSTQHENAIKIEAITMERITQTGTPSIIKSLSQIPGIDAITKGDGVATPVIRGLSTSNILVLYNGIRLENFQFSENHPYLIDNSGIETVEIIKGPASLLYGSDALGGVLNFIKEKPAKIESIEGDATIQYFSNTNGYSGNLGLKGTGKKAFWGLRGGLKDHADYNDGKGRFVPNTRFNQSNASVWGGLNLPVGQFNVSYNYIAMKPGMCVPHAVDITSERGRKKSIWYQDLQNHIVSSKNILFIKQVKVQTNLSYQLNQRKLYGTDDHPMVHALLNTFYYETKVSYASSDLSNFIVSLQGMNQRNRNQEAPDHVLPDYHFNDFSISGFVQHDFMEKIHLQVGIRFDNRFIRVPEQELHGHSHEEEEHTNDNEEEEILEQLNRYYGNLSGSIGLTYKLAENLLFRSNIASAYRTPNIAELTQDGAHGARYEQGDRNLNSQRNYEADISVHYHSEYLMFDVAGFYNSLDNYIFLSPTNDTTDDGDIIYRYQQSNARIFGIELTTEASLYKNLKVSSSYGFLNGKQSNGEYLPFIPQNKMKLEIGWSKREIGFLKMFHIKAGTDIAFTQSNPAPFETETDGYMLLNAGLGFTMDIRSQPVQIVISATNITNSYYIDHLSTLKDLDFHNPGRNIMLQLKIPFMVKKP